MTELIIFIKRFIELEEVNGSSSVAEKLQKEINFGDSPEFIAERFWSILDEYIQKRR